MPWFRPRLPLVLAAGLDAVGLVLLALAMTDWREGIGQQERGLVLVLVLMYLSLGWLFGSYTVLKLPRLPWSQLALRLGTTCVVTLAAAAALLGWLMQVPAEVDLLQPGRLIPLFSLLLLWSGCLRLLLRRAANLDPTARWQIVALEREWDHIAREWHRNPWPGPTPAITFYEPGDGPPALQATAVALSPGVAADPDMQVFCQKVVAGGRPISALVAMAEQELQRIPPRWVGNQWLLFSHRIDSQRTVQQQLKRFADVVISLALLLLCSPLLLVAGLLMKLQDGGPIIYRQCRTGLMGESFEVLKIRTMVPLAENGQAVWAQENDSRITPVGSWLRRLRLDELPQMINVLRGEMSLIGPRPERPELEEQLEREIPNYRLRHWIRPGISGWAQVNMPYGASVEDSELKLSYDLFYLRNAGFWLDLLILFKTIKIVLKAAGR